MTELHLIEGLNYVPPKNEFGVHMYAIDYSIVYRGKPAHYTCTVRTLRAAFFFAMYIYEEQGYSIVRISDERNVEIFFNGKTLTRNKEELNNTKDMQ